MGTPDMTPSAIKAEAQKAGLDVSSLSIPSESVANLPIDSGDRAHTFAGYMRIHALEATGGQTYAQMPRYATADGKGTNDPAQALKVNGQPQDNGARQVWITETALATALQSSYMASQLAVFAIVMGFALLLTGIGFAVLAVGGALRNRETAISFHRAQDSAPSPWQPRSVHAGPISPRHRGRRDRSRGGRGASRRPPVRGLLRGAAGGAAGRRARAAADLVVHPGNHDRRAPGRRLAVDRPDGLPGVPGRVVHAALARPAPVGHLRAQRRRDPARAPAAASRRSRPGQPRRLRLLHGRRAGRPAGRSCFIRRATS